MITSTWVEEECGGGDGFGTGVGRGVLEGDGDGFDRDTTLTSIAGAGVLPAEAAGVRPGAVGLGWPVPDRVVGWPNTLCPTLDGMSGIFAVVTVP